MSDQIKTNVVDIRRYRKRMKLDQFSFHHILEETDGAAIVLFTKQGCNSCKAWQRLLEEYQRHHPETSIFEVDTEKEMAIAREFDVTHLPALFLYLNGRFHSPIECTASLPVLERKLATLSTEPPREQP